MACDGRTENPRAAPGGPGPPPAPAPGAAARHTLDSMPRRHMHVTGAAEAPLRAALRELRTEARRSRRLPARRHRPRRTARPRPADLAPTARGDRAHLRTPPTSPSSPSTRPAPPTSTRRCTCPGAPGGGYRVHYAIADVAAFVDTRRRPGRRGPPPRDDPLLPRRAGPAAPARAERGRRQPAARPGPPGRPVADRPRRGRAATAASTYAAPWSAAGPSWTTRASSGSSTRARPRNRSPCCSEIGLLREEREVDRGGDLPRTSPSRRSSSGTAATPSNTAPRCPPTAGTPRSPCSPAWPRPS